MIYTNENWKPPVTYCEPNKIEVPRINKEEAIKILRDTPIDIRSTREDDIHTLYATAQCMAIEALSAEAVQGEWIGSYECSVCGKQAFDFIEGYVDGVEYLPKFCPNCGAKMYKE